MYITLTKPFFGVDNGVENFNTKQARANCKLIWYREQRLTQLAVQIVLHEEVLFCADNFIVCLAERQPHQEYQTVRSNRLLFAFILE